MYDLIILGAGPAGLTAGIYAARAELSTILIEKNPFAGGQIINTYEVDNYPGLPGISGFDLATRFREHAGQLGIQTLNGTVQEVSLEGEEKRLLLTDGKELTGRTLLIATGASNRKLGVPGEAEFIGRGVSYCATCDGAFYRGKTAAVIGGGDVAVEDAIFLARLCAKVVVLLRRNVFRAAKSLVTRLLALPNVEIRYQTVVTEIIGDETVVGLSTMRTDTREEEVVSVDGVFLAVGTSPNTELFTGQIEADETGYLLAGEDCATSVPGVFAAGDVRKKQLRQIVTAAADGANAVTSISRYLSMKNV